ncbi:TolB family protein [Sphingobacterium corticis]|uniref:TolB family protein n=1 Tax=Sphingobacterium corticis TaxID=1812823 RepID=A0ABW5NIW8_9SPHI
MKNIHFLVYLIAFVSACSKDNNVDDDRSNLTPTGNILYDNGEKTYSLDLSSGTKKIYFDQNNYSLNGWDVSWDGLLRLETSSIAGDFQHIKFNFVQTGNGAISKEIIYPRLAGEDRLIAGKLSPDNSHILLEPDLNHGIVLLDLEGNIVKHLQTVNGKNLTLGDRALMLADKSILFTFDGKHILKTHPPYDEIVAIKEMSYSEWGNMHCSRDGSKISVRIDKHIYVMNSDGTELKQVTDSQTQEREGVFSPDGNFLLVVSDYQPATFRPGTWNLNIIPLDGSIHTVGSNPSQSVIVVKEQNSSNVERGDDYMLWR